MIDHYPRKVMYIKDLQQLQNELSDNNNEVSDIIRTNVNLPKVDIPLSYEKAYNAVFPYVSTKDKNNNNNEHSTTFCVDINTLLTYSPNLDIN